MPDNHRSNWNRWGAGDERGALNQITESVVRDALGIVTRGQVVTLGVPLSSLRTPVVPPRPSVVHTMFLDGGDFEAGSRRGQGGFQFADDYLAMPVHTGTHVDALSHVARDGAMYNGFQASDVRSLRGARHLSIEQFGAAVTRALILDVPAMLGLDSLPDGHQITVDELERTLDAAELTVRAGDAVLVRTGWLDRYLGGAPVSYETEAGIGVNGACWLADHDVAMIGADNFGVEVVPDADGDTMPAHLVCLVDHGIHLLEFLNLRPVLDAGVHECLLMVVPLPIVGGVGSPVNPVAVF